MEPKHGASASTETSLANEAKVLAAKLGETAKEAVQDELSKQQQRTASGVEKAASALHETSGALADSLVAPYVEKAAEALDRLSGSIRGASLGSLVRSAEDLARRDPLLFLGGAFTLGLLAARVIKTTATAPAEPAPRHASPRKRRRTRKRPAAQAPTKTRKTRGGGHADE